MSNTGASRPTLWKRAVSESELDPTNSTINLRGNPRIYVPTERAESNPNSFYQPIPIYRAGYISAIAMGGT